jgi:hypothetical protein
MCIEHVALAVAYTSTDSPYKFGLVVDGEPLVDLVLATN